jgi:methyl-accepting chemotaxis protein
VRQSSANEAGAGRDDGLISDRSEAREQTLLLYCGLAGAALLTAGLWLARALIARASTMEIVAGVMTLVGACAVLSVLTALVLLATRVDRASEEVSQALDAVAAGKLTARLNPPRGLGREARLAGAAAAALDRLRAWVDDLRSAVSSIESNVHATTKALPRLQESVGATSSHLQVLSRDSQFLATGAEEQAALTQRACVLASVIGQSHRDTSAFAERIHATVADASSALTECSARMAELRAVVSNQASETSTCLEVDREVGEYLVVVSKTARQFKLLALHAAMEAARAGARSEVEGKAAAEGSAVPMAEGRGAEFRVVALEVRRLALELTKITEAIARRVEASRRSLQALHAGVTDGERHAEAAQGRVSLGSTALDHATAATTARRVDDSALAEAGTELTILTSAIRERATGSAKGIGDLSDRLATLDQALADTGAAGRDIEQALAVVDTSVAQARETLNAMLTVGPVQTPAANGLPPAAPRKKRGRRSRRVAATPAVGAQA